MTDTFQWQRCNPAGGSCADIAGQTSPTYLLAAADVGNTVRVTGARDGVAVAPSSPFGPISAAGPPPAPTGVAWGLFGSYGGVPLDPANPASPKARGIDVLVYEFSWESKEASNGVFSSLAGDIATLNQWLAWGYKPILSYGVHHAPAWWFALDSNYTRFKDQAGRVFSTATPGADSQDPPNFLNLAHTVGGMKLGGTAGTNDGYISRYVKHILDACAAGLSGGVNAIHLIRVGGGHFGELGYPNHYAENNYWLYDAGIQAQKPGAGVSASWQPGNPSPAGEAAAFMGLFRSKLDGWQDYQCALARAAGYTGPVAVLYPSHGASNAEVTSAVAANLAGHTSPEINGEVQRGYHHQWLVSQLTDSNPLVWCTAVDGWGGFTAAAQAGYADARGFLKGGENSEGGDSTSDLSGCVSRANALGYHTFGWIRAQELYRAGDAPETGAAGATIAQYQAAI